MGESDDKLPKIRSTDAFERLLRAIQTVGFPIVVAAFLLWEWHSVVRSLQDTMTEVRVLLVEVRGQLKNNH